MRDGTRAIVFAVAVVVLATVLAYLLKDGGIFTTATSTSILGKFGYDAARDVTRGKAAPVAPPTEECGD